MIHSSSIAVIYLIIPFYFPVFGLTNVRLTLSENQPTHTYPTLIHIYRLQQTVRNITNIMRSWQWRPRDCSILELRCNIYILQQPFYCFVGLSHSYECFWFFGIRWSTYDYPWWRDLTDDALILEALHHYKPILDRRRLTKCSVFKIRRQPITFFCTCRKWVLGPEVRVRNRRSEEQQPSN